MIDVQWIKLSTDVFDNRKIKQIESMPDGDAILVIWFKLLVLAGKTNDCGMVYFTEDIPYTDDMLSTEFGKPILTVRLALQTFEKFGMIEIVDDVLRLSGWEKYQSTDKLEKIREQNRERQRRRRARLKEDEQKALDNVQQLSNGCQTCPSKSKSIELEPEKEKELLLARKNDIYALFEGYDILHEQIDDLMVRLKKNTEHLKCENEEDDFWRLYDEMEGLVTLSHERNAKYIYAWMKKVIDTTDFQRTEPDYRRWGK